MKKKILAITVLTTIILGGCSNATTQLRDAQTSQILMLQNVKKQILLRPAYTEKAQVAKERDLKIVNQQIDMALKIQNEAQQTNNQRVGNDISSGLTGAALLGGAVWGIHELTK